MQPSAINFPHEFAEWRRMVRYAHQNDIPVHPPWRASFANFLRDMSQPQPGQKIGRRDVNKSFSPDNVEWR